MSDARAQLEALRLTDPARYQKVIERQKRYAFKAHSPGQASILNSPARFKVVRAGRRYGKTKVAARILIREAMQKPDRVVWWVANTYKNVRRGYREVLRQLPANFLKKPPPPPSANDLVLELINGTRIEFYSGTNPDAMAGEGVGFVVIDEAALQSEVVWTQTIRPTLMDHKGGALIISTPRGRNWFFELERRGHDPKFPDWESFHFSTADNPYISASEIEEMRLSMPEIMYRQEVLAEFIQGGGAIFRFDEDRIVQLGAFEHGDQLVMGLDLAKHEDFTVITVDRGSDGWPVYHDRFQGVSWPDQRAEVASVIDQLQAAGALVTIGVDATGVGDPFFDDLDVAGYDVIPIKFSQQWKEKAVTRLSADLQHGGTFLLEEQVKEFEEYEYKLTPSGKFIYSAPEGKHDDEVSAKMIAHWIRVSEMLDENAVRTISTRPTAADEARENPEPAREEIRPRTTQDLLNDPAVWG